MTKDVAISRLYQRIAYWRKKRNAAEADNWPRGVEEATEEIEWCRAEINAWRQK